MKGLSGRTIELDEVNESEQGGQSSAVSEAVPEMLWCLMLLHLQELQP